MTTVPVTGQFGPPLFSVLSKKGVVVGAKWLTDSTGASYIIDPNTGRPYIVPATTTRARQPSIFQKN